MYTADIARGTTVADRAEREDQQPEGEESRKAPDPGAGQKPGGPKSARPAWVRWGRRALGVGIGLYKVHKAWRAVESVFGLDDPSSTDERSPVAEFFDEL
ncbi:MULTISPECIES: hypothetical protein [unclassified Kitasatospora]|uniref:hypothetical protein n=1 Tax=unclassified Kitasatospora TaxID=2633591 RepID=UPI00382CC42D